MASSDEFHTPHKDSNHNDTASSAAQTPLTALFAKHSRSELKPLACAFDYTEFVQERVQGVYVLPDPCDTCLWHGSVSIRLGAYKGGCFRFHLRLAPEHPAAGAYPMLHFVDSVFHPLVDPKTGLLQLKDRFPTWNEDSKPSDVATYAKQIFLFRSDAFGTQHPLNAAALDLWKSRPDAFYHQAARCAQRSALGHTPPGSPIHGAATNPQEQAPGAASDGVFSSFLKNLSSTVLNASAEAAQAPSQLPAAEEHLMQFGAAADDVRDVRRFITSQNRTGAEMLRFLLQGQRSVSPPSSSQPADS